MRLREVPISGGTSTARITLRNNPILQAARALVKASGFDNGVCMVEFRHDVRTDDFWVLEFNPRYWGGLSTEIHSGVDFPALHFACVQGEEAPTEVRTATRSSETRWMLGELRALTELAVAGKWKEAANVFRTTPGHSLLVEDFGFGRFGAFAGQLLGYLRALSAYGNFGQHSSERDAFFDRVMTDHEEETGNERTEIPLDRVARAGR
jgi:hypothetical protein